MSQLLYQPLSGALTVQYEPDSHKQLIENPPRFTWIPAQLDNDSYILQYSRSPQFEENCTVTVQPIPYNLYTPDEALEAGDYYWRYALLLDGNLDEAAAVQTEWSIVRRFTVAENLPQTPLPNREIRYQHAASEHPRLWLQAKELSDFRRNVKEDSTYCGWDVFVERSV